MVSLVVEVSLAALYLAEPMMQYMADSYYYEEKYTVFDDELMNYEEDSEKLLEYYLNLLKTNYLLEF